MNDPKTTQIREIFANALEWSDPGERAAYLSIACGADMDLRCQVESLLHAHQQADGFLPPPEPGQLHVEGPGTLIGRYRLLQEIGEGGFGLVFMAEQTEPVRRKVALKIIKAGMDTREVIARFEAERQALALMDHPNIARVLDGGATPAGRPYFVMELIHGIPITEYCDRERLSTIDRLDLFIQVCHAVEHAHQKGIIHRDLKPGNILVTIIDGKPVPKIIDFGVAKALGQRLTEKTLYTSFLQLIGTPAYMSPEQAELSGVEVDTRSDIYSLGVLLYELLTGVTPFDQNLLKKVAVDEVRRLIRETEPLKPSTRLASLGPRLTEVASTRQSDPRTLPRLLHGDLDWIVMRSIEKDRTRRYRTASEVADDLLRHLQDQPVSAGPPGRIYRFRKLLHRRRKPLLAASAAVAVLAIVAFAWQRQFVASRELSRLTALQQEEIRSPRGASVDRSISSWGRHLVPEILNVEPHASLSPDETMLAYVEWDGPDADLVVRDLQTGLIRNLSESEKHMPGVFEMCPGLHVWSPDSTLIAYVWSSTARNLDLELRLVSIETGDITTLLPANGNKWYAPHDWSADSRRILCSTGDKSFVLFDLNTGELRELGASSVPISHARLSRDENYIVFTGTDESSPAPERDRPSDLYLLDLKRGHTKRLTFDGTSAHPIWASNSGAILFSSKRLGSWDLWGVEVEQGAPTAPPFPVSYGTGRSETRMTRSGKLIVHRKTSPADGYTIAEGAPVKDASEVPRFEGTILFKSAGRLHTLTHEVGTLAIRPLPITGTPSHELHAGLRWFLDLQPVLESENRGIPEEPRYELIASAIENQAILSVQLKTDPQLHVSPPLQWVYDHKHALPDGKVSFVGTLPGSRPQIYSMEVTFAPGGHITGSMGAPGDALPAFVHGFYRGYSWSPDGTQVAFTSEDKQLHILNLITGQRSSLVEGENPVWSPDGMRIAFCQDYSAIFTINPDGAGLEQWARRPDRPGTRETWPRSGYYELLWSPESTALMYGYEKDMLRRIFLLTEAGAEPCNVTRQVIGSAIPVSWLP
jgi:Tol biopolymer transport system component